MTESMEQNTGEKYYPIYTQISNGLFPDQNLQNYVSQVGNNLLNHPHRRNFKYEFNVINSSIPNAYALPGGKISITRGLLVQMQNEDQLAGVLGHEIGHINARHTADQYTKTILTQTVLLAGAYYLEKKQVKHSDIYLTAGFLGANLMLLKYSRNDEHEADRLGVEYMVNAGYNPNGYVELLEILQSLHTKEPSKFEALFSTHPLTTDRINASKNLITNNYYNISISRTLKTQNFSNKTAILKSTKTAYSTFDEAVALLDKKNYKDALTKLNTAINLFPQDALFYAYAAFCQTKLKNLKAALNTADKAISLYPNFYVARLSKGITLYELNDYQNAIIELQKTNELVSENATATFFLAKSFDALNDINNAITFYKKVLELTNDAEMVNYSKNRLIALSPPNTTKSSSSPY